MNHELEKGKLKRWNDEKGFGFIASENLREDIFIHISALRRMTRRPSIGDVITYQIHTDTHGKRRAVNARIAGVTEVESQPKRMSARNRAKNKWLTGLIPVFLVVLVGLFAYNTFFLRNKPHETFAPSTPANTKETGIGQNYTCRGKIYCSEMTSCDEAKFYQRNCPGTKMDGDGDGIPCESQWCSW
jgi:cold shock CspA family protein